MSNPTPTRHGAWRVVNGQLVDENATAASIEQADVLVAASTESRDGGPGVPVPPIDESTPPAARRKSQRKE